MTMTLKAAREFAGNITTGNTKMPGSTFSISAFHCKVGSKLAKIPGSTCHKCYAIKLQKLRPTVNQGYTKNLNKSVEAISTDSDRWVQAMVVQINKAAINTGEAFHRWFDSGDLQSIEMLSAICSVAAMTPHIKHWLPTREAAVVKAYRKAGGHVPSNLVIRVSATMIDDAPIASHSHTSTVNKHQAAHGHECPAGNQGNNCGSCRACWDSEVANVSYPLH